MYNWVQLTEQFLSSRYFSLIVPVIVRETWCRETLMLFETASKNKAAFAPLNLTGKITTRPLTAADNSANILLLYNDYHSFKTQQYNMTALKRARELFL